MQTMAVSQPIPTCPECPTNAKPDQDGNSAPTRLEESSSAIAGNPDPLVAQSGRRPASGRKPLFGS